MRKLQLDIDPAGYRRWSVGIKWYPSEARGGGWEHRSMKVSGLDASTNRDSWITVRVIALRIAYRLLAAEGANSCSKT